MLQKGSGGIWGQLEAAADKEEVLVRRNASIDRAHAKLEAARKARLERKQKEERCVRGAQPNLGLVLAAPWQVGHCLSKH